MTLDSALKAYRQALIADNAAANEFTQAHARKMETHRILLNAKDDLREAELEEREKSYMQPIIRTDQMIII